MENMNNANIPATANNGAPVAVLNYTPSKVLGISARDVKTAFSAVSLDIVEGADKATSDMTRDIIGAFASTVEGASKAYFRMSVLAALIGDKEVYKNLINPDTGKPFASFKELCGAEWFRVHMTTEKGAPLSYPFISQLSSVGKYFYLPSLNGDTRYDIFRDMYVSTLIQFVPFGNTDSFPMLLEAFNGDGKNPAKYDGKKLSVKAAKELARRMDNRENILSDDAPGTATENKPDTATENKPDTATENKPDTSARRSNKGRKKTGNATTGNATTGNTTTGNATTGNATTESAPELFVPVIWFNDGRAPVRFPVQDIATFKGLCLNVGQTYKNVLILNNSKAAFAVMFDPYNDAIDAPLSPADTASTTLQMLYKVRHEFAPDATTDTTPDATTDDGAPL